MKRNIYNLIALVILTLAFSGSYSLQAQTRAYRVSDNQVQSLLTRIETRTSTFKSSVDTALNRGRTNNGSQDIFQYVADFEDAVDQLKGRFGSRQSVAADVENVLGRANYIQDYTSRNRLTPAAQTQWRNINFDLNTLAQYYQITWNRNLGSYPSSSYPNNSNSNNNYPNNNYPPSSNNGSVNYRVSDREVQTLLSRIETRTETIRRDLGTEFNRGSMNGTRSQDSLNSYLSDFANATSNLRNRFNSRSSSNTDVQDVLARGSYVDGFIRDYRLSSNVQNQWSLIRTDLGTLANYYNVSWNWNSPTYPPSWNSTTALTGTYRLNVSQSDDVDAIVERAVNSTASYAANQRERIRRTLERRLTSPELIAIENNNRQITLASSNSPQITFAADGSTKSETNGAGRNITTRAEAVGSNINISYEGDRANDFYVSFMPMNNGQLRVVRRVYLENQNETVTVASVYDRTSQTAQFSQIINNSNANNNNPNNNYPPSTSTNINDFYIPNGTKLTAVLTTGLSTKTSVDGDRFTMEVRSPSQYQGAIIEGRISQADRSGRVSGRAQLNLAFDSIRLRNGQSYRFSGLIDGVRNANGDTVNINNEGAVRDSNQTTKTVTRAGIGAALGAVIGAIAGGGSGAAIGAGIGAGAGAGTVILQGRDDLELQNGTEFSLTSSAPANVRAVNY